MKYCTAIIFSVLILMSYHSQSQSDDDAIYIKSIYSQTLKQSNSYKWLEELSYGIGGRLSGSPQAAAAVEYMKSLLKGLNYDTVYLQPVLVPEWTRGEKEIVKIVDSYRGEMDLGGLALGNTIGTGAKGLKAEVIEVQNFEDLEKHGTERIEGKIVFFNRPMDPTQIRTFNAYGGAVDQRVYGASEAAKYGAIGVLVRSMTTLIDDVPHTGTLVYRDNIRKIPAISISTMDAESLSELLSYDKVEVYMRNTSKNHGMKESYNIIGEVTGSEFPDEIILIGGHLDSWDVGHGSHDDGAGCIHAIDAIQTLLNLRYKPKRTWRTVLFMNEENGLKGALEYARVSNENEEFHLAAIESDAGGFSPRGFGFDAHENVKISYLKKIYSWQPLLEPYELSLSYSGSGADIAPLKSQEGLLIGLRPDSQRYFDIHHTAEDTFDKVNKRELELGTAAIASIVFLVDKYGLSND